ncbi:uncharacterized protein DUF4292 [Breznakibacter xylanolyticus]|uniref:Uncharacterized protein DUF4292 n=1 Tax=Breznakibacter xylanolyticus TaxID=990 RepID=A0A2W7P7M9_9BACT|nr:DUF4292 domain-containing protein [Breznakibacter xylanolyticus]PZX19412.1 uncharacterized protein DUF4292 [Breznakibacter xylanolyticus]
MKFYYIFFLIILTSCASKKKIAGVIDVKPISASKLLDGISENQFVFDNLYIKKFDIDLDVPGINMTLRGSMFIQTDSQIVVSVTPLLGIEVARALISPSQLVLIDRTKKKIYYSDYALLSKKLGMPLNFSMIQSLFINQVYCDKSIDYECFKDFDHGIQDGMYFLKNYKQKQNSRRIKSRVVNDLFIQYLFDPLNFTVKSFHIEQTKSGDLMNVHYNDFKEFNGNIFPTKIDVDGSSKGTIAKVGVTYLQIEFNSSNSIGFKVPEKYEVIYIQ